MTTKKSHANDKSLLKISFYIENGRKKPLFWSLKEGQKEAIQELGLKVEPYIWEVSVRKIQYIKSPILKRISFAHKKGKKCITIKNLSKENKKKLDDLGINLKVIKYKIEF